LNGVYTQDTAKARALLAASGYKDNNGDGIFDIGGINLEVTVIVPPWGLIPEVAQLLQDQWQAIGVKTNLEAVPTFNALIEKVKRGQYNLVAYYTFGLDPSFLNAFFTTGGGNNWTGFSSPDLDNALREAVHQNDSNIRRDLYDQAQRIIMDNAIILPIRDYVNLNAAQSSIKGLNFDAFGWFPIFSNITIQNSP
jgi:peptide/nickel transport system substrate-binding protein